MEDFTAEQAKENLTAFAMKHLCKMLREDPVYRIGWQANIAIAFQDEWIKKHTELDDTDIQSLELIHEIANKAADRFLRQLEIDQKTSS